MKFLLTANRINEAINLRGMTSQELSNLSSVAKASISQYRNGSNKPSNLSAGKMSEVLKCNPLWLMGYDVDSQLENKTKKDEATAYEEKLIIEAYRSADSITKTMVQRNLGIEDKLKESAERLA